MEEYGLREGIAKIQEMAVEANTPQVLGAVGLDRRLPDGVVGVLQGGRLEFKSVPTPPVRLIANSAQGLLDAASRTARGAVGDVTFHVGGECIVALVEYPDGDTEGFRDSDQVRFRLATTLAYALLFEPARYTHKQFCRLLRTDLRGTIDDSIVHQLSTLKTTDMKVGESTFQNGTEGLGMEISRKVGGDTLPKIITVTTHVYENTGDWTGPRQIECLLDIEWIDGVPWFTLVPTARQIADAQAETIQEIVAAIREWVKSEKREWNVIAASEG